ncbi:hypothetical protein [Alicycliphilus denitrificans]|uniref:hypothetical protein n=1 Tax=Alicycliphilus denitrificans TaxID=179636 RepID=UPI0001D9E38A|nr:hypothetical protein [Alicycliphilus denitrificans]ADV01835.1 hypothetical protein Alide_4132 [Alicycliphilus denitrificans BC]GAO25432.1 hypothetical protein ALISP_5252 [Alicycliphilus sp. B1]
MSAPQLLAIVEVEKAERVYCAQPGCKHTVYKAIHVVQDGGQLMALGSTCFATRYGSLTALGQAQHWGGKGKLLTSEERALLQGNTEALLARFAEEEAKLRAEAEQKLKRLRERLSPLSYPPTAPPVQPRNQGAPGSAPRQSMPWSWMKPMTSVAAFKMADGSGWVRVQHKDGRQFIVPWPTFEGWEEAWPPAVGRPNLDVGGYEAGNVIEAVAYLRARASREKVTGLWNDVMSVLGPKPEM